MSINLNAKSNNKSNNNMGGNIMNNITSTRKNILQVIGEATINGEIYTCVSINNVAGCYIGGNKEDVQKNIDALQFWVDQAECDEQMVIDYISELVEIMADLDENNIEDAIVINDHEYFIDYEKRNLFDENATIVANMDDMEDVPFTKTNIKAILAYRANRIAKENKIDNDITSTKLSIMRTIINLWNMGLRSTWFSVNGKKQSHPTCYSGEKDKQKYISAVQACLNNHIDPDNMIITACKLNDAEIDPHSLIEIETGWLTFYFNEETGVAYDSNINEVASIGKMDIPVEAKRVLIEEEIRKYLKNFHRG